MNNDLIRREALREIVNAFYDSHFKGLVPNELITYAEAVDDLIDNAPTVEPLKVYEFKGCDNCELERPKGEWVEESSETGALGIKYTWFKCNQCGWNSSLVIPRNFCPNCGADMREAENDI